MNKIIELLADLEGEFDVRLRIEQAHAQGSAVLPLSSAQQGIRFAQQIDPSSPAYNIGEYIELNGRIDALLFERALRRVVVESEALRVQIIDLAGQAGQIVGPPPAWSMPLIDVGAETDPRATAELWMRNRLGAAGRADERTAVRLCFVQGVCRPVFLVCALPSHCDGRSQHVAGGSPASLHLHTAQH